MTDISYTPVARISELALEPSSEGGMASMDAAIGTLLQLTRLGCVYTEVAPGETACPYHVHHAEDEVLVILAGEGEYRFGGRLHAVRAGDVLGAPLGGPDYAHQLFNTGPETLKYLVVSSKADLDVLEFPDSGKFLVSSRLIPGTARSRFFFKGRTADMADDYDGEVTERRP
ncbi:cupin domain-containing protein [Pelagibacterium lacus]|uniref:Cupin domain-containing protein n=1 Tax=Pelagibacterium lacus TaxID=2282655 RepID=A0A369W7L8_9HYPH|nr:cupin domain-containing protein [Pelagibacterium lacus]RDE09242.1 cupin domain-containing protein [Pelagibacterium lacus]